MIYLIVFVLFLFLWHRTNVLEDKIAKLKNTGVSKAEAPVSISTSTATSTPAPTPAPVFAPASSAYMKEVVHTVPKPPVLSAPAPEPAPVVQTNSNTEFNLGSKVFTSIGAIAVLLGVGFFLRYAFENNLISEGTRVLIGCVFGIALVALGHYLRNKYLSYGMTLVGSGFGVFYLSIYSAYSFYNLIDPFSAFIYLTLVTFACVGMSIAYDSRPLIGFSFAGAFIMPFLLPFSGDIHTLFIYLLIVNSGALLVARFKVWPILTVGSLLGTALIYLKWTTGPYTDALFTPTLAYCTIIFLSYFTTSLLNFIYRDRNYEGVDGILLYGTPVAYFLLNVSIMGSQDNIAILALVIGLFNFVMFCMVRFGYAGIGELKKFSEGILFMSALFIAAAIGLHFDGSSLTIIWALQAAAMVLIGNVIKSKINTFAGVALSVITGFKMFVSGLILPVGSVAIFNERSGTFFLIALMYGAIWAVFHFDMLKGQAEATYEKDEAQVGKYVGIIGLLGTIFLWINLESYNFVHDYILYLPIFWLIYALIMISLSFFLKEQLPRFLSYLLIFLAFGVMLFGQWDLDPATHQLVFNVRVLTALVFALVTGFSVKFMSMNSAQLVEGEKGIKNILLFLANISVLWAFTFEIITYFNQQIVRGAVQGSSDVVTSVENTKRVTLSIFWLLYALAGLGVGILRRSLFARYFSIALFAISIFKIFLYDTANLSDIYRFVSFIVLGVILLVVGFVYYRFKDRINEFVTVAK